MNRKTCRRRALRRRAQEKSDPPTPTPGEPILNLSKRTLTDAELLVLDKGMSFVATSTRQPPRQRELEKFRRNINLHLYASLQPFANYKSVMSSITTSSFNPPEYLGEKNPLWTTLLKAANPRTGPPRRNNLSTELRAAWTSLRDNPETYLTTADKGGKPVLIPKEDYIREALRQLQDTSTYEELSQEKAEELLLELKKKKTTLIGKLFKGNLITRTEQRRLVEETWEIPPIYFLPKIHKPINPTSNTYPGRPIIGATSNMLKTLDVYISKLTSTLLRRIPNSLSDTTELLMGLESTPQPLPNSTTLFSADVESLYPSIPWTEGTEAARNFYNDNLHAVREWCDSHSLLPPPPANLFGEILSLILENNIFHFQNRKWFRQRSGTAMGCSISVFLANTFMAHRMRKLREDPPHQLRYLGRYIDDIVGIWDGNNEIEIQNSFASVTDENIKLSWVFSQQTLVALDLRINLQNGRISTRTHTKPTDGHQYVHWTSAHPAHLLRSIPKAQLLRRKRNCSNENDFQEEAATLLKQFRARGYPQKVLKEALRQVNAHPRTLTRNNQRSKPDSNPRINLVCKYDKHTIPKLKEELKKFYSKLLEEPLITERRDVLGKTPIPEAIPRIALSIDPPLGRSLGKIFKKGTPTPSDRDQQTEQGLELN